MGSIKKYIFKRKGITELDISDMVYDGVFFDLNTVASNQRGGFFKPDGTKFYTASRGTDTVYEYTLSTPWDVSAIAYSNNSVYVNSQDLSPYDLHISVDGTKLFLMGNYNNTVFQYTLSTPWDLSTMTYDTVSFNIGSEGTDMVAIVFNNVGDKMYILSRVNNSVYQYTLLTAWDLSTASYDSISFSVSSEETYPVGMTMSNDGNKLFISGTVERAVHQYTLSTSWDLSTASYDSVFVYLDSQDVNPYDVLISSDASKFYVIGVTTGKIYQYSL